MGYKESFIELMVESGVLTFGEFITKSGRKSPYFINTGNYRTGAQISKLEIITPVYCRLRRRVRLPV